MSIKYKLFLFIISIAVLILFISSSMQYYFIKNDFKEKLFSTSNSDMPYVVKTFKNSISQVSTIAQNFSNDQNVINTINLISNYQDKENYEAFIYDREKLNLLNYSKNILSFVNNYTLTLYDVNSEPIIQTHSQNKTSQDKIYGYQNGQIIEQKVINNKKEIVKKTTYAQIALNHINRINIKKHDTYFIMYTIQKIYKENKKNKELIGFVKLETIIGNSFFASIENNIYSKLTLVYQNQQFGYPISLEDKLFENLTNAENHVHHSQEIQEREDSYVHIDFIKFDNLTFNIVLSYSKEAIKSFEDNTIKSVIISMLLSLIFGFIMSLVFIQRNILSYLNELIHGLTRLSETKNFKAIKYDINTPLEFKFIADKFNIISQSLSSKIQFEEITNDISSNILKKHDDFTEPISYVLQKIGSFTGANKTFFITKEEETNKIDLYLQWEKTTSAIENIKKDGIFQCEKVMKELNTTDVLYMEDITQQSQIIQDYIKFVYGDLKTISCFPLIYNNIVLGVFSIVYTEEITVIEIEKRNQLQTLEEILVNLILRKKAQDNVNFNNKMMFQQSKMAAMGEMIENIAHQWRQPLSLISTCASGIKLQKDMNVLDDKILDESIDNIVETSYHLSSTIDDFREFFKQNKQKSLFETSKLFNKALKLLSPKLQNKSIHLVDNIENIPMKTLDNELIHVIMNLLNNAYDVLEADDELDKKLILINAYEKNNHYIITIQDNAKGIDSSIIDRVFEPYFTTKHKSQGTGIGLYMSKEIIERHLHGTLSVKNCTFTYENSTHTGASFKIKLPL